MPVWGSLYFQNAASPVIEQLIFFHDHTMIVLVLITILVGYILMRSLITLNFHRDVMEGQEMERVWTVLPALFLLVIALPSLKLLYLIEEMDDPDLTVKSTGRQWYWIYEYADFRGRVLESYIVPEGREERFRLLEVDNILSLPVESGIRVVVTRRDVIHSWTVPVLGVRADGIPGRLNQMVIIVSRPGIFVGQCSEICGSNHSFIPIVLRVVGKRDFLSQWS